MKWMFTAAITLLVSASALAQTCRCDEFIELSKWNMDKTWHQNVIEGFDASGLQDGDGIG
jgi:hypothetical protein